MNRLVSLTVTLACTVYSISAAAQFAKSEDAIKYRQSTMFVQNYHMSRLGAMANGRVPYDAAAAVANAEIVERISHLPWAGFAPSTEGGKAKPEIWKEQAKFKENQDKLTTESAKLLVAAKAGNVEALKAQFNATGETCKTCHDAFRSK